MIKSSYDLLYNLKRLDLLKSSSEYWWPDDGSFRVIVSALLTQQSRWQNVQQSLNNLKNIGINSLQDITKYDLESIKEVIKPSGFYNQKAQRLKLIAQNIIDEFDSLDNFKANVTREWLLNQKGFGYESSDSVLCYFAYRDVMVVDNYTLKLLKKLGFKMDYHQAQKWICDGIKSNLNNIYELYGYEISLNKIYARMHGKIVEFSKNKENIHDMFIST
jgi:endonuclease-3 related protein